MFINNNNTNNIQPLRFLSAIILQHVWCNALEVVASIEWTALYSWSALWCPSTLVIGTLLLFIIYHIDIFSESCRVGFGNKVTPRTIVFISATQNWIFIHQQTAYYVFPLIERLKFSVESTFY